MKNLSHISFERMTRRYQEMSSRRLLGILEELSGKKASPEATETLSRPPRELDFVHTALENTLSIAYERIHEAQRERELPDLRLAAYVLALERVGQAYLEAGIFP